MKAIVNQDTCIGCGLCISTVPEAIDACPVQAISAED